MTGLVWLAVLTVAQLARSRLAHRLAAEVPRADPQALQTRLLRWQVALGLLRGLSAGLVFADPGLSAHYLFTMVTIGATAGGVASVAGQVRLYLGWLLPAGGSLVLLWAFTGTWEGAGVAVLLLLLDAVLLVYVRDQGRAIEANVALVIDKEALSASVEAERDRALALAAELEVLSASLRVERDKVQAESASKTRLFAAASHDLRQPLYALGLNATALALVAKRSGDALMLELSQSIDRALQHSNALLEGLLDVSRLDAEAVTPALASVDLGQLLAGWLAAVRPVAEQRGLALRAELPAEPLPLQADAQLLGRIVHNLLGNALKFTEQGSVTLRAEPTDDEVVIEVRDTGPGIPPESQALVFEEFFQLGNPTRDRHKGLGLGLAIVRRLVRLLDLRLEMTSEVGRGTCFRLHLPRRAVVVVPPVVVRPAEREPATPLPVRAADGPPLAVLLVDDEPEIVRAIENLLTLKQWPVRAARDGDEALSRLADGWRPDVLLVDYRLPGDNGLRVIERLRAWLGPVPAVMVTGDATPQRLREAGGAGIPIVHKPINGDRLLQVLRQRADQADREDDDGGSRAWLSQGAEVLAARCEQGEQEADVIVVGSGYGGAVAAARLSALGVPDGEGGLRPLTVWVLERGREWLPGDFPDRMAHSPREVRWTPRDGGLRGFADGLYDVRLGDNVSALVANGVGGGSLINAGVAARADDATLADPAWPARWRDPAAWAPLYDRAEAALGATAWPAGRVPKDAALRRLAGALGGHAQPVRLTVQPPGLDDPGDDRRPPVPGCAECGDCFSGCNVGAKRTLSHGYLARAWRQGAQVWAGATVQWLQREADGRWRLRFVLTDRKRMPAGRDGFELRARHVVLAAGTFGSTELLLRSARRGLPLSPRLGRRFSTNGDGIGVAYDTGRPVHCGADEQQPPAGRRIGPTITQLIDLRRPGEPPERRMVVQDLTAPGPLKWLFDELLGSLVTLHRWTHWDLRGGAAHRDGPDPAVLDGGALDRSLMVVSMGHDGARGRLSLHEGASADGPDGQLAVRWGEDDAPVGLEPCFVHAEARLRAAAGDIAEHWLSNPMWRIAPVSPLMSPPRRPAAMTVHPLGGCAMAETAEHGVADPAGRVFAGAAGTAVHDGLWLADGSLVPTSLGINPLLTITALAEGLVDGWVAEAGWQPHGRVPRPLPPLQPAIPRPAEAPVPTTVRYAERMAGPLAPAVPGPDGSWTRLVMTCRFDPITDLATFLRDPAKRVPLGADLQLVRRRWDAAAQRHRDEPLGGPLALRGEVHWFERQPRSLARRLVATLWAFARHRLAADLGEAAADRSGTPWFKRLAALLGRGWAVLKAASHFGAPRRLRYRFDPLATDWVVADGRGGEALRLPAGTRLFGAKTLVYDHRADPWTQLTELPLQHDAAPGEPLLARLAFDALFELDRDHLPLRLATQADGLAGARDLLSLGLFMSRVLLTTHFPSFREAQYPPVPAVPHRRFDPARVQDDPRYQGLDIQVLPVPLPRPATPRDAGGNAGELTLGLTRLRRRGTPTEGPPLLLLHGFGSGGIQYLHPAIAHPLALTFADAGRDVWVGELRTSIALDSHRQQWVMDDVARQDIPALVAAVQREAGWAGPIDIAAHCIGSAMFCMAVLSGALHGRVRAAALMQVSPVVHLPPAQRLRGFLGHRARALMPAGLVDAAADEDTPEGWRLIDRVLGTMPQLAGDDGPERRAHEPAARLRWSAERNGWRTNALRSAGVFGQLFQWPNMDDDLLAALPHLLGACNLTTYQQTVQYAFRRQLTNQAGDDAYVTDENLRRYFDFPVLFVHGERNDVFDPRGTLESAWLLRRVNPRQRVHRWTVPGFGHLDCVVGLGSREAVHRPMVAFLADPLAWQDAPPLPDPADKPPALWLRDPAVGPWLGEVRSDGAGGLQLRVGLRLDEDRTPTTWVLTALSVDGGPPQALQAHRVAWQGQGEAVIECAVDAAAVASTRSGLSLWVACSRDAPPPAHHATWLMHWADARRRAEQDDDSGLPSGAGSRAGLTLSAAWLKAEAQTDRLELALGSCRQAPWGPDRGLADAPFERLLRDEAAGGPPVQQLLLVGDQVYADAWAGVSGGAGTPGRFTEAYREAWRAPALARVMASRPVTMTPDDHEFLDDYGQAQRLDRRREYRAARAAWWRYQLAAGPAGGGRHGHHALQRSGFQLFVCDTRSRRRDRRSLSQDDGALLDERQWRDLADWLQRTRDGTPRPRFIAMASPLCPLLAEGAGAPAHTLRTDAWQRFPASMARLLRLIAEDGSGNLVLLAGDYHCFADVDGWVGFAGGPEVPFRSVVTGPVFAPYGFVNVRPSDLLPQHADARSEPAGPTLRWGYRLRDAASGHGLTRVTAHAGGPPDVRFDRAG
ncbi:ATP-binding protein [Aquabacterium sp. J223]|uniref:ATP-binding protein n=1 Tax=Aquabacterium sp. J223 TaxID=2898431 RepID=UPI0021AD7D7A|nr:ATP-binding protein [Aquabacterium sp. J223]UUX96264.1 ATP-binding protein [Aquabacterium sp. J223]